MPVPAMALNQAEDPTMGAEKVSDFPKAEQALLHAQETDSRNFSALIELLHLYLSPRVENHTEKFREFMNTKIPNADWSDPARRVRLLILQGFYELTRRSGLLGEIEKGAKCWIHVYQVKSHELEKFLRQLNALTKRYEWEESTSLLQNISFSLDKWTASVQHGLTAEELEILENIKSALVKYQSFYRQPALPSAAQILEERKMLRHQAGFNIEELMACPLKITTAGAGNNSRPGVGGGNKLPSSHLLPSEKMDSFSHLGFELLQRNLAKCGYKRPTPVQQGVIPALLAGKDVLACSQTGSGKTASYLLPIVSNLAKLRLQPPPHPPDAGRSCGFGYKGLPAEPSAVIIVPVRELTIQVAKECQLYLPETKLSVYPLYGGTSVVQELNDLREGNHSILVATPGRLLQFLSEQIITFQQIKYLTVDEGDKMFAHGFLSTLREIFEFLPAMGVGACAAPAVPTSTLRTGSKKTRQFTMSIFSVSLPPAIQKLANTFLSQDYIFVSVGALGGASYDVHQKFQVVESTDKYFTLLQLVRDLSGSEKEKILIFCETREATEQLATKLANDGLQVSSLHGLLFQVSREQHLEEFRTGKLKVLVATGGLAAHGMDIPGVSTVINYDFPSSIDEYILQIGRTGRVGHQGTSISFFEINRDGPLAEQLVSVLRRARQPIPAFLEKVAHDERFKFGDGERTTFGLLYDSTRTFNSITSGSSGAFLPCEARSQSWD